MGSWVSLEMKHAILLLLVGLLSSCTDPVMKRAHVIPIYDGQILLSAHPEFTGPGKSLDDDADYTRPTIWSFERQADGSTIVHWVSPPVAREELVFMDSGFHPIVVPSYAIVEVQSAGQGIENQKPTVLDIVGSNSAFIPDHVTLVPYKPFPAP